MLQSLKEIINGPKVSNYQKSEKTRDMVAKQIISIWGKSELKNYDPDKSALTFTRWLSLGYKPKKGSKALKSITYIEKKDEQGKIIKKYARKINLFYYRQVEPIKE